MIRPKTFIKALKLFSSKPERVKEYLLDRRLSVSEKTILQCYFLLRDNKLHSALEILKAVTQISDPFVEAQKNLLLGMIHNNMGNFPEAKQSISSAIPHLKLFDLPSFEFIAFHNLFIIAHNLQNGNEMRHWLIQMAALDIEGSHQEIRFLRCEFILYMFEEHHDRAEIAMKALDRLKQYMCESDRIGHLVNEFCFYVKQENFEQCRASLDQMKKYRKFHLTENFNYMKKMLFHYFEDAPLYIQDDKFQKDLLFQLKVIQCFEEMNYVEAEKWWGKLSEMLPAIYMTDWQYKGEKNLFSLCLDKHLARKETVDTLSINESSRSQMAVDLLCRGPVQRDILFKCFWGTMPKDKNDLTRLSHRVHRLKRRFDLDIVYRKGCYLLKEKGQKIA